MFPRFSLHDWLTELKNETKYDLTNSGLSRYDEFNYEGVIPPRLQEFDQPDGFGPLDEHLAMLYEVSPSQLLVTCRCQHSNFIAAATARDLTSTSGASNTVVEVPTYNPLYKTPVGLGSEVRTFHRPPAESFAIDPERVRAVVDENTSAIFITNRHNPSGFLTPEETMKEFSSIAVEHDSYLVVDEVYAPFFLETPHRDRTPFGGVTAVDLPNTVITNSMTKFLGLYDISIGWIAGPEEFITHARTIERHTNAIAKPSREFAKCALANADELQAESREMLKNRYELLDAFVSETDLIEGHVANPSIIAFVRFGGYGGDAVVEHARSHGVAIQPGRFFSNDDRYDEYFRISLGRGTEEITSGLATLKEVLHSLSSSR